MKLGKTWLTCALCACSVPALAQQIAVVPTQAMSDQTALIEVTGAAPGARVTINADLTDGAGHTWISGANFIADALGSVDTAKQAPIAGSYRSISAMGLVWSMQPKEPGVQIYTRPYRFGAQIITFHLLLGGKNVASAQFQQVAIRTDVQQVPVDVMHGVLFTPAGAGTYPGILVIGGSEGGTPLGKAAWLASHGYVAFALCYFRCSDSPDTPRELKDIPLEYFGRALNWLIHRPEVAADRLAIVGTSRGGELALELGSIYPAIKAVVAYVPADFRHPSCCDRPFGAAWTWKGRPLPWALREGSGASITDAAIAVENINGPILMIGAKDDGVWPSAEMVESAVRRLHNRHFAHPLVVSIYAHAGHRAGTPEIEPKWASAVKNPTSGRITNFGGTPEGNAEATLDAIPKVLDFLQSQLRGPSTAN